MPISDIEIVPAPSVKFVDFVGEDGCQYIQSIPFDGLAVRVGDKLVEQHARLLIILRAETQAEARAYFKFSQYHRELTLDTNLTSIQLLMNIYRQLVALNKVYPKPEFKEWQETWKIILPTEADDTPHKSTGTGWFVPLGHALTFWTRPPSQARAFSIETDTFMAVDVASTYVLAS